LIDPRFTTQAGIYDVLEQADAVPGVHDIYIGSWLAWPAVKVLIYARLCDFLDAEPMASPEARRVLRGVSLFSRLPSTWLRLGSELAKVPSAVSKPRVAWLSGAYPRRGADGTQRDALFGDVPDELGNYAEQLWLLPPALSKGVTGIHAERVYEVATDLANQLASLQRFRPAVRNAARALAEKLSALAPSVAGLTWQRVLVDALAMFEARRIAWTRVFARLRPAIVLLTNAPYQVGEVAAAKDAGATVAEFQHGLFGPRCPEYGWPGALASRREGMPVADRFFVFGDLFRGGALKKSFWRPDDVRVIGSAEIERLRAAPASPRPHTAQPRVLFLTQPMTRSEAIGFLDRFLDGVESGRFPRASVTIKVHPSERHASTQYEVLATRYPRSCMLAKADDDTSQLMVAHDLVVSYTSYALIEAVGLGRAAISISGQQSPGGVFALCPIPGAAGAIPTVSSPEELAAQVTSAAAAAPGAANGFFAPQPPGTLLRAILDLLTAAGHPVAVSR
jgi:hypothetical protein